MALKAVGAGFGIEGLGPRVRAGGRVGGGSSGVGGSSRSAAEGGRRERERDAGAWSGKAGAGMRCRTCVLGPWTGRSQTCAGCWPPTEPPGSRPRSKADVHPRVHRAGGLRGQGRDGPPPLQDATRTLPCPAPRAVVHALSADLCKMASARQGQRLFFATLVHPCQNEEQDKGLGVESVDYIRRGTSLGRSLHSFGMSSSWAGFPAASPTARVSEDENDEKPLTMQGSLT